MIELHIIHRVLSLDLLYTKCTSIKVIEILESDLHQSERKHSEEIKPINQ